MKRPSKSIVIACGLTMSVFAAAANAQVAPPPTKPTKKQPTYTPPPKPTPKPSAKPTEPKLKDSMTVRKRDPNNIEDLPNIPYPKLGQPGPDGRIIRLRQLPDILALTANPTVGPKSVDQIMPLIYLRRYKMETSVIDNIDLYWQLTNGLIENMDMGDINELGRVADMMKPLVPEVTLSQDLENRNILTRTQAGMNRKIVNEYKKEITDEIQVLDGDQGLEEVMRFVLNDSLQESNLAYQGLLVELMPRVDTVVEKSGVDSSEAMALVELKQTPSTDPAEQIKQIQEFDEAFRKLSYDDAVAVLNTMRSERKFENVSPTVTEINVMRPGKTIMPDDEGIQTTIKDDKGQVRYKSSEHKKKMEEKKALQEQEQAKQEKSDG